MMMIGLKIAAEIFSSRRGTATAASLFQRSSVLRHNGNVVAAKPSTRCLLSSSTCCDRYYSATNYASESSSSSSECENLDDSTTTTTATTTTPSAHFGQQQCDYLEYDYKHVLHPYTSMTKPLPTFPVRSAKGVYIELENGRQLVDGMSSWWAAVHGYQHAVLDVAVRRQLEKMSHVMFGGLTHRPASELCHLLVHLTPDGLNKVFLCDSGSVSVEVAMKMAVQYWYTTTKDSSRNSNSNNNKKTKFLSLRNGYHGDTFGAMSVCDPVNGMHSMFTGMLTPQLFVDSPTGPTKNEALACANKVERVLQESSHEIAAIICEPIVQGAGGMKFYHPVLLQKLRHLCDEYNILLIFDEIATGFGRTGTLFACQQNASTFTPWYSASSCHSKHQDDNKHDSSSSSSSSSPLPLEQASTVVVPDIMCLGKALTGGYMSMGATVANDRIAEGISSDGGVFMHGPTFMGNPLACATALASLDLLVHKSPWLNRVKNVEAALIQALAPAAQLPTVQQVRVLGAIGVVQLVEPVKDMAAIQQVLVQEHGVWLRPFGKLLYTMPPFNCPDLTMDHVHAIGRAICSVAATQ